jgi:hypothetical protein
MVIMWNWSLARVYKHIYIYIPGRIFFFLFFGSAFLWYYQNIMLIYIDVYDL